MGLCLKYSNLGNFIVKYIDFDLKIDKLLKLVFQQRYINGVLEKCKLKLKILFYIFKWNIGRKK